MGMVTIMAAQMTRDDRFYAFVVDVGRFRLDVGTEDDRIAQARSLGASLIVRERGPVSRPTDLTIVWRLS